MKIHRQDSSFIVERNGLPFQVIEGMKEHPALLDEYASDPASFEEEVIVEPSFDELKENKKREINAVYEQIARAIKIDTPESEVSTWYIQETEATEWSKDNTYPTPFIDGLANARQVDRLELIKKVLYKVNAYKTYMGNLTGQRQYFEDRINSATTKEEIEAITW